MIKRTITQVRPNTSVPFSNIMDEDQTIVSEEAKAYITNNFVATNKLIFDSSVVSEDGLTWTLIQIWADQQAIDDYNADAYILENVVRPRIAYFKEHSLESSFTEEVI